MNYVFPALPVLLAVHLGAGLGVAVLHSVLYASLNAMIYGNAPWAPWSWWW